MSDTTTDTFTVTSPAGTATVSTAARYRILGDARELVDALDTFAGHWADGMLADSLGSKLTCQEADALVSLLVAVGELPAARYWADAHAAGDDDPDDEHYSGDDE